jgi:hypothetical protein
MRKASLALLIAFVDRGVVYYVCGGCCFALPAFAVVDDNDAGIGEPRCHVKANWKQLRGN